MPENFFKIKLIQVEQKDYVFYAGKINCKDLLSTYVVHPTEYDLEKQMKLRANFFDDADYFDYLISETEDRLEDITKKGFQRTYDSDRVREIGHYVDYDELPLFPNAIIASCDLINDISAETTFNDSIKTFFNKKINLCFLEKDEDEIYLYVPRVEKSIILIDGQHRVEGLRYSSPQTQEKFELLISFILGYDRSALAKLFFKINYTQKSVNKSLIYHLMGEFSSNIDEIKFLHEAIKLLNESNKSPLYRRVKMLGKADKHRSKEERKLMTLSQAFLIDYTKYTITQKARCREIFPIFLYYYKNNLGYLAIRFVIRYFKAVESIMRNEWNNPEISVLSKTTGVGALLKLMNYVFIKLFVDNNLSKDPSKLELIKINDIVDVIDGIQDIDWNEYLKGSSAGQVNKLKVDMINHSSGLKEFADPEFYKREYAEPFWQWLNSIS